MNEKILDHSKRKSSLLWICLLTGFVATAILGSMGYIFYLGNYMVAGHAPLIDATMEIKLEATTGHCDKAGDIHDCLFSSEIIDINGESCMVSIARDIAEQRRKEAELAAYRGQLQSLVSELTIAEERERRKIAGVLHDDVIQKLSLSKMKLRMSRWNCPRICESRCIGLRGNC